MDTFPILIRKDGRPIRYLVVDDSVFARKNVAKMVEAFGGEIVGRSRRMAALPSRNMTAPRLTWC